MKEEFILTLSPKYIPSWGKWEAFRELMQNVIDRSHEYEKAEIIFNYNTQKQRIIIGNKFSSLDKKTLVMGETTKANDDEMIGQYGEGYKLAMLVLLRLGTRIRIRTNNEVWAPEIKFQEKFGTELLTITVMPVKQNDDLMFELDGVTPEDFRNFYNNCLYLNPPQSKISTSMGDILMDEQFKSKLFVEGLFVCEFLKEQKIRYGYNMKSKHIQLDRDRRKVETFNVLWEVGRMYGMLDSTHAQMIFNMQVENYNDVSYYETHCHNKNNSLYQALCSLHYNDFVTQYGKNVIPVRTHEEANFVRQKYNSLEPVILNETKYRYITSSTAYEASTKAKVPLEETPYSIVQKILKKYLSGKDYKEIREKIFEELLPLARQWRKR